MGWRIRQLATAFAAGATVTGVGAAILATVLAEREQRPPDLFLDVLEVGGYVLLGLGLLVGIGLYKSRSAEKPRPYLLRVHMPEPPTVSRLLGVANVILIPNLWIENESDETHVLEFRLKCDGPPLGMYPYRDFYREHRSALKDNYLSNTTHLVPRGNREGHLPFMMDGELPDVGTCVALVIRVNPPNEEFRITFPTPPDGQVLSGEINS